MCYTFDMKKTPENKMITTGEENTKDTSFVPTIGKKNGQKFYFPKEQKTVFAESLEEAVKIINNQEEK